MATPWHPVAERLLTLTLNRAESWDPGGGGRILRAVHQAVCTMQCGLRVYTSHMLYNV